MRDENWKLGMWRLGMKGLKIEARQDVLDENHCANRTINKSSGKERCDLAKPPCRDDATDQSMIKDLF